MSATGSAVVDAAIRGCRPANIEPIVLDGDCLSGTAPGRLRELKSGLSKRGYQPATLSVTACFTEDCSLATQEEADRLREYVRAAAFLGAGRLELECDEIAEPERVKPALAALSERASRDGVDLVLVGAADIDVAT